MHYIVLEIQKYDTIATLINSYDDRNDAYGKYYAVLSAAATSKVPLHAASILTEEGQAIEWKYFTHSED